MLDPLSSKDSGEFGGFCFCSAFRRPSSTSGPFLHARAPGILSPSHSVSHSHSCRQAAFKTFFPLSVDFPPRNSVRNFDLLGVFRSCQTDETRRDETKGVSVHERLRSPVRELSPVSTGSRLLKPGLSRASRTGLTCGLLLKKGEPRATNPTNKQNNGV